MSETARNPFAPTTVAVYCLDGPDSLAKRKAAAQAHLRRLESDPYFARQFWASIDYRPFLPAAGALVGATVW